jgi:hypothetical protein
MIQYEILIVIFEQILIIEDMSSQFGSSRAKTELDCVYHPKNPIYNFCCSPECLLPMCATCVGIHALEHHEDNTIAHFAK